uniref:Cobalamin adenosyltransferase n=1 Tax=uncultured bacterium UPO38 TaxID=1776965 RepID=A0A126SXR6_9BACT|nr:hypothetical protein Lcho_3355 [uncultured bacterium UPO38]
MKAEAMPNPFERSVTRHEITTDAAADAVRAAVAQARELGLRINAAVTDDAGRLVAFLRMNGAFGHSIEIAIDKAVTAAGFGLPTAAMKELTADDELLRIGLNSRPRLVMFGGGLPIRDGDALIGGIGVSGGSAEQDEACARAGLAAIGCS